jgi:hypothetical protein
VEGGKRRDQLEETRHYQFWRRDFELCNKIGARYVRYGRCPGVSGSRPRYAKLPLLEDFSMGAMRGPEA